MAFNDGFYWYKNVLKKQLKLVLRIYLSIAIVLSPIYLINLANASAAEKWTIEEISYDNVAKNIKIQAEKNFGPSANDNKYKVKVPVTASAAGSTALAMIRGGIAGAAILGLVEGVGWIIENGVVKKKDPESEIINSPKLFWNNNWYSGSDSIPQCKNYKTTFFSTFDQALAQAKTCFKFHYKGDFSQGRIEYFSPTRTLVWDSANRNYIDISSKANPNYSPDKDKWIPVTPSEMGDEIINSPAAPQILPNIYNPNNPVSRPSPAPDAADKALENAPPIPKENPKGDTEQKPNEDTDEDGEPDVFNPEKPSVGTEFTLPEFCSWAVTVCQWYTKYKEDSDLTKEHREAEKQVWSQEEIARQEEKQQRDDEKSFWQKVEDWFDWTKDDSDLPEKEQPDDIPDLDISADEVNLSASSTCPQDSVSFSVMGKSVTLDMPYQPVCDALNFFKPAVLLVGAVASVYIVAGVRTKEEDQA